MGVATPSATYSYNLTYWNGTGYTTAAISDRNPLTNLSVPAVSMTTTVNGLAVTVSVTNTLTTGGSALSLSGTSPCQTSECKASASVTPPLGGDIFYTVTVGSVTVANLDINVNLGTSFAQTNYRAAPSVG